MRTTISLDPDIAATVERMQTTRRISQSEAINQLAREGLNKPASHTGTFTQRTVRLGLRIDVSNIAETLELLDGLDHA